MKARLNRYGYSPKKSKKRFFKGLEKLKNNIDKENKWT